MPLTPIAVPCREQERGENAMWGRPILAYMYTGLWPNLWHTGGQIFKYIKPKSLRVITDEYSSIQLYASNTVSVH